MTRPSARRQAPEISAATREGLAQGEKTFRADAWVNAMSGLGTARDKASQGKFTPSILLTEMECEWLYAQDDFARLAVSAIVEDSMRPGFKVVKKELEDEDPKDTNEKIAQVEAEHKRLKTHSNVKAAAIWGRTYGRGGLVLNVTGGGSLTRELTPGSVKEIKNLTPLTSRDYTQARLYGNPLEPMYGEPELWLIQRQGAYGAATNSATIHESRIIPFGSYLTPPTVKAMNHGRDLSALQALYDILMKVSGGFDGVCSMLTDISQGVIKMRGLISAVASGKSAQIAERVALADSMRSVCRALLLDADGEDFQMVERGTATGTGDILDRLWLRLAAAIRMPVSRMLGQDPAGLNATGEVNKTWWYDLCREYQRDELTPPLEQLTQTIVGYLLPDEDPECWSVEFLPLEESTPTEEATLQKTVAETDNIYLAAGVLLPEEVALCRFGKGKWTGGYDNLDMSAREDGLEAEQEKLAQGSSSGPIDPITGLPISTAPELDADGNPVPQGPGTEAPAPAGAKVPSVGKQATTGDPGPVPEPGAKPIAGPSGKPPGKKPKPFGG